MRTRERGVLQLQQRAAQREKMSWANVASVAQLAVSLALILRFLVATADPITQAYEQTFERTTYIVPASSTENDSEIYRGNLRKGDIRLSLSLSQGEAPCDRPDDAALRFLHGRRARRLSVARRCVCEGGKYNEGIYAHRCIGNGSNEAKRGKMKEGGYVSIRQQ